MGTDIYGCIEVRDPCADEDWYDWEPWQQVMDLSPLYSGQDFAAFGCLFGVRNYAGWEPLAADRGLPVDVSSALREEFEKIQAIDPAVHSPTWVTWAELDRADMDAAPVEARGVVLLQDSRSPATVGRYWVRDRWPSEVAQRLGTSAVENPADVPFGEWRVGSTQVTYRKVTVRDAVGPGTGWEHVFAVMRALAGRFGNDGVRLVVYFD